jgi:hypothetical protein
MNVSSSAIAAPCSGIPIAAFQKVPSKVPDFLGDIKLFGEAAWGNKKPAMPMKHAGFEGL